MKHFRMTSTKLISTGKQGIFTPDKDGYYELPVGGLNAFNSVGELYTLEGAIDLFKGSSILMRRLQNGKLKSELGHPKPLPRQSDEEYMERLLTIEETNVTAHIKELWLDHDFGKNNPQFKNPALVAIMAKLCPSGPHGPALKASLDNKHENVCFSVRGLTQNFYNSGRICRVLKTIVTFDQVTEQGISTAEKWNAPSLESLIETPISEHKLRRVAENKSAVATESSRELATEALKQFSVSELPKIPLIHRW